jgi:asparagine synthase (glutamine-hydrolysing)
MTCIVARLRLDSEVLPNSSVASMLDAVSARAPDGCFDWRLGRMSMGVAHLRTGSSARERAGRLSLDGNVALAADVRLDNRTELLAKLRARDRNVGDHTPDSEVVLHAYHAFGDSFLEHVLGDFALVLWDETRRKLIAARDRFGVRPLYVARLPGELLLASQLESLLALHEVPKDIDNVAVGDFMLWGMCNDAESTIYSAIRTVPPAHRLEANGRVITSSRYWELRRMSETRFKNARDYVERFSELFGRAVAARVPDGPFAISLSGGMDSSSIAAAAMRLTHQPASAHHMSPGSLVPDDDEENYARCVAEHLGLRFVSHDLAPHPLFNRVDEPGMRTASPCAAPFLSVHGNVCDDMASRCERVLLSGQFGDAAVFPSFVFYSNLLRTGRWWKLAIEMSHHIRWTGSVRGMSLRTALTIRSRPPAWKPRLPDWLDRTKLDTEQIAARWEAWWREYRAALDTEDQLALAATHRGLELAESLPRPVVMRYPFLDLELIEYLVGLPNFTRADKWILRESTRGLIPEEVRVRPKTGAPGDPVRQQVANGKLVGVESQAAHRQYIDWAAHRRAWKRYREGEGEGSTWTSWLMLQPIAFAHWCTYSRSEVDERNDFPKTEWRPFG